MRVSDIIQILEESAPLQYQESYDNSGLLVGDKNAEIASAMLCLDSTEEVIDEAIAKNCKFIIAHHPIVFSGIKKLTGEDYVQRVLIKAIKNDIAIYAGHTNFDNIIGGVNSEIASKLNVIETKILRPKQELLYKLRTFVPLKDIAVVQQALFSAGAGNIGNYDHCSFSTQGSGSYRGNDDSNPSIGQKGREEVADEVAIEIVLERHKTATVLNALLANHPYEEVAYDLYPLENAYQNVGSGIIGKLAQPMKSAQFLAELKEIMKAGVVKHTAIHKEFIEHVAICGGSGAFLIDDAKRAKADIYVTSDIKYHEFFDADNEIIIADIGHYESEQYTTAIFAKIIKQKFPNFALHFSTATTNPVNYI